MTLTAYGGDVSTTTNRNRACLPVNFFEGPRREKATWTSAPIAYSWLRIQALGVALPFVVFRSSIAEWSA